MFAAAAVKWKKIELEGEKGFQGGEKLLNYVWHRSVHYYQTSFKILFTDKPTLGRKLDLLRFMFFYPLRVKIAFKTLLFFNTFEDES